MIVSHCDSDHYGGLWDLIDPNETYELDAEKVEVKNFYHAGLSRWKNDDSSRNLGPVKNGKLTLLLEDKDSVVQALGGLNSGYRLQGYWAKFMQKVVDICDNISRLSNKTEYVPNYTPDDNSDVLIKVLGPIETSYNGSPALEKLGGISKNTNGHSVLLRVDYGCARILLTGDLNKKSQDYLLDNTIGQHQEFACDVGKGCHHGSEDISYKFLSYMSAAATIISSGDNEGHSHPRPNIVAASALTGHIKIENDEVVTPLIYSTEIARSVRFGRPYEIIKGDYPIGDSGKIDVKLTSDHNPLIKYTEKAAGDLHDRKSERFFNNIRVVGGIRYGLINIRTDGRKILCATLSEKNNTWDIKTFESRF